MPKSILATIGVLLLGMFITAAVELHEAYSAGLRAHDLLLSRDDANGVLASLGVTMVFAIIMLFFLRHASAAESAKWRQAWPQQVRRIEFFGNHFTIERHLARFASTVGAQFAHPEQVPAEDIP